MHLQNYVLVSDAYDAWKRGDIEAFGDLLSEHIAFSVPSATSTYVGAGTGREELKRRLRAFLDKSVYNAPFGLLVTLDDGVSVPDPRIVPISLSALLWLS